MSLLVDWLGNALPDLAILAVSALAFATFGGAVAWLSNRLWFRRWPQHAAYDDKLADTAHSSLLGLSVFVLALMITNGLSSLARTEDSVRQESVSIYRLGRELDALGPQAAPAKAALAAYAQDVGGDEWRLLASAPSALSPLAQRDIDVLWRSMRALQQNLDVTDRDAATSFRTPRGSSPCASLASRTRAATFPAFSGSSSWRSSPWPRSSPVARRRRVSACR